MCCWTGRSAARAGSAFFQGAEGIDANHGDGNAFYLIIGDISVTEGSDGNYTGIVRTIMLLGHYVVITVQHGDDIVKCNVDRELSDRLKVGDQVSLQIGKHNVF